MSHRDSYIEFFCTHPLRKISAPIDLKFAHYELKQFKSSENQRAAEGGGKALGRVKYAIKPLPQNGFGCPHRSPPMPRAPQEDSEVRESPQSISITSCKTKHTHTHTNTDICIIYIYIEREKRKEEQNNTQ